MTTTAWSSDRIRHLSLPVATYAGIASFVALCFLLVPNMESGLVVIPIFVLPGFVTFGLWGAMRVAAWAVKFN
jgi:hypothetical protein